jgi:hypothetical protein
MKRLLLSAAAASALAFAAPCFAQDAPTPSPAAAPGQDIHAQIDALRARVKAGFDSGELTQDYTKDIYRKLDRLQAIEHSDRSASGALSEHDRTTLQERIDRLSRSIHWKRVDGSDPAPMAAAPPPPPEAAPASAGWTLAAREDWLQARIDHGVDAHRLSGNEVARGQNELQAIRTEQARLLEQDGGALSEPDRTYLVHRIDQLNQTLRWEGANPPAPWAS